jgi:hypothetical protein
VVIKYTCNTIIGVIITTMFIDLLTHGLTWFIGFGCVMYIGSLTICIQVSYSLRRHVLPPRLSVVLGCGREFLESLPVEDQERGRA